MEETAANIAGKLLKIKAVKLSPQAPFTWASGLKSPLYCDNRQTLSWPEVRNEVKMGFITLAKNHFPETEVIAGVATAGVPHGALLADALNLPFVYVRSKAKGHGLENLIEGRLEAGQKVLVVEDLVSTGMSSLAAVQALKAVGAEVIGLVSVFSYGFPNAEEAIKNAGLRFFALTNLEALLRKAIEIKYIQPADFELIKKWQKDPQQWSNEAISQQEK